MHTHRSSNHFWRIVLFIAAACIFAFLFLIGFMKAFVQDYAVRREIRSLEKESAEMEHSRLLLLARLQDIKSGSFIEKEARLKFGLQKPGESVIILNTGGKTSLENKATSTIQNTDAFFSNIGRWRRYFFGL